MIKLKDTNIYPLPEGFDPGRLKPFAIETSFGSPIYYFEDTERYGDIWKFEVRNRFSKDKGWTWYRFGGTQVDPYAPVDCDGCGCK